MHRSRSLSSSLSLPALLALVLSTIVSAYRPVQFVKHTGESGRADQAFSLVNHYNETSQQPDLYVRMQAFRYQSSAQGWAALALGPEMKGALMFIIYGDPAAPDPHLTMTVRTADGHHPPRPLDEMKDFYSGDVPDVDVVTAHFEPYTGDFFHEELKQKPSHLGIAEFIVRGYNRWTAAVLPVSNATTGQAMIWSSNFKQDFGGDFSPERNIDMHQFGLGFGFLWTDLKNALSPVPFFGPIKDTEDHKGVSETGEPAAPTNDELTVGEAILLQEKEFNSGVFGSDPFAVGAGAAAGAAAGAGAVADSDSTTNTPGADDGNKVEEPVKTPKQWNVRSLMWHIHGILMTVAFLVLYPLGIYFLRSSRTTSFNLHWTINSLGSMSVSIGAIVGFVNSRSISIAHQYLGILLVCALAVQTVLGWRHHIVYLSTMQSYGRGRPTWMAQVHVWLGRVVLPLGMLNVISGLLLRHYGWLTVALAIAVAAVQIVALVLVVGRARKRPGQANGGTDGHKLGPVAVAGRDGPSALDEAAEYFQLTADDEEFSDDDDNADEGEAGSAAAVRERDGESAAERARREQEEQKREQQKRLARLDKV
ncbi:hypothetical protein A1O1_00103 [Capronia coronata CBS 617.96]|uniref:Cytochrome b561 domain-containing protein n=1 Tax=Capronia coronata CBS 617.96 TaxID=1182541 RepID=W9YZ82_9EURO|nr:uncharacterized protein A1O1_00103 [Capronia coronata CBS 617.96]EXJ94985.1 hypothetical protein A1O1_00103 [Capronia coronata CBS 617.96]